MKKNLYFASAALACGFALSLTSCTKEDNPVDNPDVKPVTVISFENQKLNADGFWCGTENEKGSSYLDDWGSMNTVYPNTYTESGVTVDNTYTVSTSSYGSYDYWSGFAISSRTETTFSALTLTPDQYNNVIGQAHSGKQFLVAQYTYSGEGINLPACKVKGFWFTNSAYTLNSILNGDNYSGAKFGADDWLSCNVTATKVDGTTATVSIDLASKGKYVSDWQFCDLSSLGAVTRLEFTFSGSRNNAYGLLTPAYICIDDLTIEL